jgi:hypothetical protein
LRLDRRKAAPLYDDMVERAIETKVALAKTKVAPRKNQSGSYCS